MSSASAWAVSYRRVRSFSRVFITIQSRSPLTSLGSSSGLLCRDWATSPSVSPSVRIRVEGFRRLGLADDPLHLRVAGLAQRVPGEGRHARQQLVEQHAQRVDVRPRVDVQAAHLGLLGAHVLRRADHLGVAGEERLLGEPLVGGLGDAEVDDLGHGLAVVQRDQDVGRLDVAVDDSLLVGVLDGVADLDEQLQPLAGCSAGSGRSSR